MHEELVLSFLLYFDAASALLSPLFLKCSPKPHIWVCPPFLLGEAFIPRSGEKEKNPGIHCLGPAFTICWPSFPARSILLQAQCTHTYQMGQTGISQYMTVHIFCSWLFYLILFCSIKTNSGCDSFSWFHDPWMYHSTLWNTVFKKIVSFLQNPQSNQGTLTWDQCHIDQQVP